MVVPSSLAAASRQNRASPFYAKRAASRAEEGVPRGGLRRGSADGHKFVFFDFGRNPGFAAVVRFDAHDTAVASYVHVTCGDHLLRQRQNEIDLAAILESRFG